MQALCTALLLRLLLLVDQRSQAYGFRSGSVLSAVPWPAFLIVVLRLASQFQGVVPRGEATSVEAYGVEGDRMPE